MGNRLSKIYTRTGDDGSTGLGDGSRVQKDGARVTAYGTTDELNSIIGMVRAQKLPAEVESLMSEIQHQLFDLGGELCIPGARGGGLPFGTYRLSARRALCGNTCGYRGCTAV